MLSICYFTSKIELPVFNRAFYLQILTSSLSTITQSRQGIKDVVISLAPQTISAISALLVTALLARGLGPIGMGQYALIASLATLPAVLSDLGIGNTALRYASRAVTKEDFSGQLSVLRWAFRVRMTLALIISVVLFLLTPFIADTVWNVNTLSSLMQLSLLIGLFTAISSVPIIYFQSLYQFNKYTMVSIGQTIVTSSGVVAIALLNAWSLKVVIIVSVLATGIAAALFQCLVPREAVFKLSEIAQSVKTKFRYFFRAPQLHVEEGDSIHVFAFFMILSAIIVQITLRADLWLIGYFLDKSRLGLYNVATKYTLPLSMLLGALTTALWPRAAGHTSSDGIMRLTKNSFRLSIIAAALTLPYAFGMPLTTTLIFGPGYQESMVLGQLLCLRFSLAILIAPLGIIGFSMGLIKYFFVMNILQMFIVIGGNLLLLPRIGIIGSAITLLVYEIIGSIVVASLFKRKMAELQRS